METGMKTGHYHHLAVMTAISFASMYVLMYSMTDSFANVYGSLNQFYMAGLMAAPMLIIEVLVMSAMYQNKRLNGAIIVGAAIALTAFFAGIRRQTGISDRQFLRSMISHHASAILMCEQASLKDAEVKKLCGSIIAGQSSEIAQMKAKLSEPRGRKF